MKVKKAHEILRLQPGAAIADLKLAYRDLVSVWHPDRFQHNPRLKEKAEQQLQEINEAYETVLAFLSSDAKDGLNAKNAAAGKPSQSRPNAGPVSRSRLRVPAMPAWLLRFLARSVDGIIFALMIGYTGAFRAVQHPVAGCLIYFFSITLLWAFVEANLLSSVGTTPGKWLLGIRVMTYQGNRPALLGAFKRSIGVWWYGLGAGIVPVMPVMMAVNCMRLMQHRPARWDQKWQFIVAFDPRGYLKTTAALAIVLLGCWLLIR